MGVLLTEVLKRFIDGVPIAFWGNPAGRGLLKDLAGALRNGDSDAAAALLRELRRAVLRPIPEGENAALLYDRAFASIRKLPDRERIREMFESLSKEPLREGDVLEMRRWFSTHAEAWAEIRASCCRAVELPQCRFIDENEPDAFSRS